VSQATDERIDGSLTPAVLASVSSLAKLWVRGISTSAAASTAFKAFSTACAFQHETGDLPMFR
jgi:hypothetical protein